MTIRSADIFQSGNEFRQILFLDSFYQNVSVEDELEEDLKHFLTEVIAKSPNLYIKRAAFKILCDLTLIKRITNPFSCLEIVQNFLMSQEHSLQAIALKYIPHFPEIYSADTEEKLKECSDDSDGEVAGQAYLCLGLVRLTSGISKSDIVELATNLSKAKVYFQSAIDAVENRDDAQFYLFLIAWIESVLSGDTALAQTRFAEIEKNLQLRSLYDFDESFLELDFLIFKLIYQIKSGFEIASASKTWLAVQPQMQGLLCLRLEGNKIRNLQSSNKSLVNRLFVHTLETIESAIYTTHLASEKERLNALNSQAQCDSLMVEFIEHILSIFPDDGVEKNENVQLLALLSESLGSELGLVYYERITSKEITLLNAVQELLRNNLRNELKFRTGSIQGHEVLLSLMKQVDMYLPNYNRIKFKVFFDIVEEVIRYVRATLVKNEKKRFPFLFSKEEKGKGQDAVEVDLQDSMYSYLEHSKIADGLEHEMAKFVDGGRVDILYKKDVITIPIELKKSLSRPNSNELEKNYIAQAQTYTAGYDQLGIFVLLELSDKSKEPPPNFKDWFKVHHLRPSSNMEIEYPDCVISVVIPGNRTLPSSKSIYK
jgi:hypothetical protein